MNLTMFIIIANKTVCKTKGYKLHSILAIPFASENPAIFNFIIIDVKYLANGVDLA